MLYIGTGLGFIAELPKSGKKTGIGEGLFDHGINILLYQTTDGLLAFALGIPFGIMLSAALRGNDGKAMLAADGIGSTTNITVIGFEIIPVLFAIQTGNGIE